MAWMLAGFVVLLSTQVFGHLARWARQPFVMGELVGGVLLGPAFLGTAFPNLSARLFSPDILATMHHLGELGVVLFCVGIGRELRHGSPGREARSMWKMLLPVALLPGLIGVAAGWLSPADWRAPGGNLPAFLIVCFCAMTVTALPVLGVLLRDLGVLRHRIGSTAMTIAGLSDLACWLLLAVALELQRGRGWGVSLAHLGVIVAAAALVIVLAGKLLGSAVTRFRLEDRAVLTVLLVGTCGMAVLAGLVDLHPAIAALVFGVLLPPGHSGIERVVEPFLELNSYLLMPFFLVGIGFAFHPWTLGGVWAYLACATLCAAAIGIKLLAGAAGARFAGQSWRTGLSLGMLLSARGFTEILLLSVGRSSGIIGERIFTVGVVVTVVTTLAAAPGFCLLAGTRQRETPGAALRATAPAGQPSVSLS